MRNKSGGGPLTVHGIAGTHVVLLGIDLPEANCPGVLGFAIRREDHTEDEKYWLEAYKTFGSVEPNPAKGVSFPTRRHPIQSFTWSDYSAKPGHDYTYEIVALRGTPANSQQSQRASVRVQTETAVIPGSIHHVHFNRGAAASQEYTRRFGDRSPDHVGQSAFDWLSRGAAEAIDGFVRRATDASFGLRVCAYEFTDDTFLQALKDASEVRHADVKVRYHAKNDDQKDANEAKIGQFGLGAICEPRNAVGLALSHNKVIVLLKNGAARAVLTGSTNFSKGGIYGHSNVVHICEDAAIADRYLGLWTELAKNIRVKDDAPTIEASSPLPPDLVTPGTTQSYSPRPDLTALEYYADRAQAANDALFMTFAFGMHPFFQAAYRNGTAPLRYALMEKMSGPTKTVAQREANEALIIALRKMEANKFAIGAHLAKGAFNRWVEERLSGLNVHVKYLHTKYMLVDPLGPSPLVVSGSANFSGASATDNDENMLVIRGDPRVADIYLGEFMRLYSHFAFRDFIENHPDGEDADIPHLDETDVWWKRYFGTSFASRQRQYFAG